jgi:uncharacterized protein (TIGR02145 family)
MCLLDPPACRLDGSQALAYALDPLLGLPDVGQHVPTDQEWKGLEMDLGMSQSEADSTGWRGTDEGGKLKATGTSHWESPLVSATNESGFSALPGGLRACCGQNAGNFYYGAPYDCGRKAWMWTSGEQDDMEAWFRHLDNHSSQVERSATAKGVGLSVRCVQDG